MLLSAFSFAVMGVFVKLTPEVATPLKVIFRNLVTLLISLAVVVRNGRPLLGEKENQRYLIARSLLGIGGVSCYFYSINHLLLADAAMLNKLSPFVVALLALVLLKEVPGKYTVLALVIAFLGGLLVLKPRFDLSVIPALVGLASAVFAGSAYAAVRFLRGREAPETIIFHFSVVTAIVLTPISLMHFKMPGLVELMLMTAIGITAAAGQFGLTMAYHHAPAAEVSLYTYTTILFSAIFGYFLWSEVPDVLSLIGGLMIIGGGVLVLVAGRREHTD